MYFVVQLLCSALCNPWTAAYQAPPSSTNSWSSLKFMSIESMVLSNHLILCPPPPLDFNLSQHRDLFQWVSCSHQVARILELQLQHQSFQWIFRVDFLSDWLVWSPWCPRDSQESSAAPQFEGINSLVLSLLSQLLGMWACEADLDVRFNSHIYTWILDNTVALAIQTCVVKVMPVLFNMLFTLP